MKVSSPVFHQGTKIVVKADLPATDWHRKIITGETAVITRVPTPSETSYRIKLPDGLEAEIRENQMVPLKAYQIQGLDRGVKIDLERHILYQVIVGSRAYGLDNQHSDTDVRGFFLPPASLSWSLHGVPEQLEDKAQDTCFWELRKFLILALKGNPNILECLYSPLVLQATPLAKELLAMRHIFLSRMVYQTYNGYVLSQFKKMDQRMKQDGSYKHKHAMHLIRLHLSGIALLRHGALPVQVTTYRDDLLAIRRGERTIREIKAWHSELQKEFDDAFTKTKLPERPDYEAADRFLIKARSWAYEQEKLARD